MNHIWLPNKSKNCLLFSSPLLQELSAKISTFFPFVNKKWKYFSNFFFKTYKAKNCFTLFYQPHFVARFQSGCKGTTLFRFSKPYSKKSYFFFSCLSNLFPERTTRLKSTFYRFIRGGAQRY